MVPEPSPAKTLPRHSRRLRAPFTPRTRKLAAAGLLTTLVAIEYLLSTVPMAADLEPRLTAPAGTEIVLAGVEAEGPLLSYSGRIGEAADVRFDRARLSDETIALLRSIGIELSPAEAQMSWITGTERASRTIFEVSAPEPGAPIAELRLRALAPVGAKQPQVEVETRGGPLHVTLGTPFTPEAHAASRKTLTIDGRRIELPGAIPLKIIVSNGTSLRARFAQAGAPQPAEFVLGGAPLAATDTGGLKARSIGVRRSDPAAGYEYFACAANAGAMSWDGAARLSAGSCRPSGASIAATRLRAGGSDLDLELHGAGWSQRGGELAGPDILSRFAQNRVLAGVLLTLNAALAAWLLLELFGPLLRRGHATWSGGVFISYRRDDSAPHAGRLHDRLSAHFGEERVFMDVDTIALGEDFARRIRESLDVTDALLAVIGRNWTDARDGEGRRRLDDPKDFVRTEIVTALERGTTVIPVLVAGAKMPREQDLPSALKPLCRRNAIDVSDSRFSTDVRILIESLEQGTVPAGVEEHARNPV